MCAMSVLLCTTDYFQSSHSILKVSIDTPPLNLYNKVAVDSFQPEGGVLLEYIIAFLISIVAGIVCYYICKWLDRDK